MKNPFIYSNDNKRYHTWNYYLKNHYQCKVFKVALNANFTCPNRDGTCGVGGCTFCSSLGSGDYAGKASDDLMYQFEQGLEMMRRKWPNGQAIAYFQAFTNTYAPLHTLKETFQPFVEREDVLALAIATRADALNDENIAYLDSLTKHKDIWIEVGLQSIHEKTAKMTNRGHDLNCFIKAIDKLAKTNLKVCVHFFNSLPNETKEEMIETARFVGNLPVHAIKIHMLHLLSDSVMGQQYLQKPFPIMSKEDYIDVVVQQLECLPAEMIIQRLTGDAPKDKLIVPEWTLKKVIVLNDIDKEMKKRDTYQGKAR